MDIALEVALFIMAILLVSNLQMELKRKIFVVTAFGLRLALVSVMSTFKQLLMGRSVSLPQSFSDYTI